MWTTHNNEEMAEMARKLKREDKRRRQSQAGILMQGYEKKDIFMEKERWRKEKENIKKESRRTK